MRIVAPPELTAALRQELPDLWSAASFWPVADLEPTSRSGHDREPSSLTFTADGRLVGSSYPAVDAAPVQIALAELTTYLVARSPLFCVHAGVVSEPGGCIVLPGDSGQGKTTLTAALVAAGFGYLSDEVLAVDRSNHALWPYPRPLAVDARSWRALGLDPAAAPEPGRERMIAPAQLGSSGRPGQVKDIVLFQRHTSGPDESRSDVRLERIGTGEAVRALLANSFNHYRDGASSFRAAAALGRGAQVWRLTYHEATEAAGELARRWL